jgi:serine/threonine-protein kinase
VISGAPPTAAADVYGAGVVLYELFTGTTPFAGGTVTEVMGRHLHDDVVPPSLRCPDAGISPALDRIVMRALAKRPEDRFADAATLAEALAAVAAGGTAPGRPSRRDSADRHASPTARTRRWSEPVARTACA